MNYKIADAAIGFACGGLIAGCAHAVVPDGSSMLTGMFIGGVIGMALQFVLLIVLLPVFGGFETMIPLHLIGMPAGMLGGMTTRFPWHCIAVTGALWGLAVAGVLYVLNKKLTVG